MLLALLGAAFWFNRGVLVQVVPVSRGSLVQTVVMSGRVATDTRTEVASQVTARIAHILVQEGDEVQAGQALVQLHNEEALAAISQADAAVAESRARIREIQTILAPVSDQQLALARASQAQSQAELERTKKLVQQGFVSQSRLDEATRLALAGNSAVRAATAQAQGNQSGGASLTLALARLDQALAARRAASARLEQMTLRATESSVVIARTADPGDTAQPGKAILTLAGGTQSRIHATVDEKNLKLLQVGQPASVIADAYADQPFPARLGYMAPAVDAQRGTIDLRLTVLQPPKFLRPDMTVSVEIETAKRTDVLKLPSEALRRDADGTYFVLVDRDAHARKVVVRPGLRGSGSTEIADGLAEGDRVVLPGKPVANGDKIRADQGT